MSGGLNRESINLEGFNHVCRSRLLTDSLGAPLKPWEEGRISVPEQPLSSSSQLPGLNDGDAV